MFRRSLLALAGMTFALGLAASCGPIYRSAVKIDALGQKLEAAWMPNRLDWTVYQPSHRVALATITVLKAELAEARVVDVELTEDDRFNTPDGKLPKPGEARIPDDYPAFWMDEFGPSHPAIVNCRYCSFEGKTKDGKKVDALVRLEIVGNDQRTVLSLQVGHKSDEKLTKTLIDKISQLVHEPTLKPGSPEELAALNVAFAPRPADDRKVVASGEVRVKKN